MADHAFIVPWLELQRSSETVTSIQSKQSMSDSIWLLWASSSVRCAFGVDNIWIVGSPGLSVQPQIFGRINGTSIDWLFRQGIGTYWSNSTDTSVKPSHRPPSSVSRSSIVTLYFFIPHSRSVRSSLFFSAPGSLTSRDSRGAATSTTREQRS